ncbi:MAG: NAD(P)-dependent oxidoreductase [Arenicellales bacterium]
MYKNKRVKVGFVGIGLMGRPMVLRLLMANYDVNVWNRTQSKLAEVLSAGAIECSSVADVAAQSDVILFCLANANAVEGVATDVDFLEALSPEKLIVDLSSISPGVTAKLADLVHSQSGATWVDAPVSGGVPGAEQGTLVIMAGGDQAAIDTVRPLLAAISNRVTRMGPVGAGQTTKLCNQIIVGCNIAAIAEAIRLAEHTGVDAALLPEALAGGFADSLPFQIFGKRMAAHQESPVSIKIATMLKDLAGAIEASENQGIDVTLTITAADILQSRCDAGDDERCITSLVETEN